MLPELLLDAATPETCYTGLLAMALIRRLPSPQYVKTVVLREFELAAEENW